MMLLTAVKVTMVALDFISAVANAVANVFNYFTSRSTARQVADIKAGEIAKQEQASQDKANTAIEKRNIDEIRKNLSE